METLSARAADILGLMEPDLGYSAADLRQFAPELSTEALREVMQELWIERLVERSGYGGWKRVRPARASQNAAASTPRGPIEPVKPEDLFDHDAFEGIFK
jgi:hypothetical protein